MANRRQKQFLKLYEPVHERFERFCRARAYGGMDFKDLMNESLLKAYENFHNLRTKEAFLAYLIGISIRVLAQNHRKRKEVSSNDHQFNRVYCSNIETSTDYQLLLNLLNELPENQREALVLFEITGFSLKEIAKIQGVSLDAVKQRIKRGRDKMRNIMSYESNLKTGTEL